MDTASSALPPTDAQALLASVNSVQDNIGVTFVQLLLSISFFGLLHSNKNKKNTKKKKERRKKKMENDLY